MSGGYHFSKKGVDKERFLYYDSQASSKQVSADVAELADALDSGSSGHCARAGSSPVIRSLSRTMVAYIALSEQDNRGSALYRQGILFVFIVFI